MLNSQGRPTSSARDNMSTAPATFTGNRALRIEEALIFEIGRPEVCGVDFDEPGIATVDEGRRRLEPPAWRQ